MGMDLENQLAHLLHADSFDRLAWADDEHVFVRDVEDEIERRGLEAQYVLALGDCITDILDFAGPSSPQEDLSMIWRFLRATPEQKLQAARVVLTPAAT